MPLDISKVKDKSCVYELRVPATKPINETNQERVQSLERQELQANLLGVYNVKELATEKQKSKVRESKSFKQVKLGLSGERLIVRFGSGFCDFIEYLERKGLL